MQKTYTREEVKHISGIDLWREDVVYKPETIDIRTLSNYEAFKKEADVFIQSQVPEYFQSMVARLKMGGGLPAMIVENNNITDGFHRMVSYIIAGKYDANVMIRVPIIN